MGRPGKLTAEVEERIVQAIRAGSYFAVAARAAGVSESTFYRWLARGAAEPDGPYAGFRAAVLRAEAESELHAVVAVRRAAREDWRAALALLERRHRERWGRRQPAEAAAEPAAAGDGGRPKLELARLSDEELETLEELIARAAVAD